MPIKLPRISNIPVRVFTPQLLRTHNTKLSSNTVPGIGAKAVLVKMLLTTDGRSMVLSDLRNTTDRDLDLMIWLNSKQKTVAAENNDATPQLQHRYKHRGESILKGVSGGRGYINYI